MRPYKQWILMAMIVCVATAVMAKPKAEKNPLVLMETSHGDIIIELYKKEAPITVDNFLTYVRDGFYSGTIFHRVINGFVIQGGGFEPGMEARTTRSPIKNEAHNGLKNKTGTIAMARSRAIDSATSQFFINVADNSRGAGGAGLDHVTATAGGYGYCVFGRVVEGMSVVNHIKSVKTGRRGVFSDVPKKDVIIENVTILRGKKKKSVRTAPSS